ncbi:hypothetical protein M3193_12430 [Sporosarcina luteola]|uniref:hypothetical protein n=1 Tax=Sporosarcina luteola TaxID=582850 RepID=UPI00203D3F7E|nr:hypothetical protein [Sporosarcina luteola]MCM3744949.1 hypothetical protein [Sporosarcina luteola]
MKKRLWMGSLVVVGLIFAQVFFPYSVFSVYQSVSVSTELPILQDYKMKLYEFKKMDEENEGKDSEGYSMDHVKYATKSILETYEMDMLTTSRSSIGKGDLNIILEDLRFLQNRVLGITFEEPHNYESRKYLYATLRWSQAAEEEIVRIISSSSYSRFHMIYRLEEIQNDIRTSFDMYTKFYEAYYWYEGE